MGVMPPYDPFEDRSLAWAIARVASCEPARATWAAPALVRFEVERTLRGTLPRVVIALFDAPREAAQTRFYVGRAMAHARLRSSNGSYGGITPIAATIPAPRALEHPPLPRPR